MPGSKLVFPVFVALLIFLTLISITKNEIVAGGEIEQMDGVSVVAPSKEYTENPFSSLKQINANWIAIMPYAFCSQETPQINYDDERQWWGEKSPGIIKSIESAKQQKLKIMMKPHVWIKGQGWTGEFRLNSEEDWQTWERSYETYILHFAQIADSLEVEAFCVGLEFNNAVKERPEFWPELIMKVRTVYKGKITYAANWDNYKQVHFWDQVDFIGINAYFPLSEDETPSVNVLKSSWIKEKRSLYNLCKKYQKPLVFTEYGYRSINKAAGNQWELDQYGTKSEANFQAQENAYTALFETFWNESWFQGGFLWKWYPEQQHDFDYINSDYTPQHKPVEKIISAWYHNDLSKAP